MCSFLSSEENVAKKTLRGLHAYIIGYIDILNSVTGKKDTITKIYLPPEGINQAASLETYDYMLVS